jgi:hypothetical protein
MIPHVERHARWQNDVCKNDVCNNDVYDGMDWTAEDIDDLVTLIRNGWTIEQAAECLGRSGSLDDVKAKARALGLIGDE